MSRSSRGCLALQRAEELTDAHDKSVSLPFAWHNRCSISEVDLLCFARSERIHKSFVALGAFTVLSTLKFSRLKNDDGRSVGRQRPIHAE